MDVLVDASVALKWFVQEGEAEVSEARAVLRAHQMQTLSVVLLDLIVYELGNALIKSYRGRPNDLADQLADLVQVCGPPIPLQPEWRREAAMLGDTHRLTFYDAAYAAAARGLQVSFVSADRQLLASGLAESPTGFVRRLRLPPG